MYSHSVVLGKKSGANSNEDDCGFSFRRSQIETSETRRRGSARHDGISESFDSMMLLETV